MGLLSVRYEFQPAVVTVLDTKKRTQSFNEYVGPPSSINEPIHSSKSANGGFWSSLVVIFTIFILPCIYTAAAVVYSSATTL